MPGGGGGEGGSGAYAKRRGGGDGDGGGEGGTKSILWRNSPLMKTSPGERSSTSWITPQLRAFLKQKSLSIAVMPPAKCTMRVCTCAYVSAFLFEIAATYSALLRARPP